MAQTGNTTEENDTKKIKRRSKEYIFKRSRYNIPIKSLRNRKAKLLNINKNTNDTNDTIPEKSVTIRSYKELKHIKIKIPHKTLKSRKPKLITETEAQMVLLDIKYNTHIIINNNDKK